MNTNKQVGAGVAALLAILLGLAVFSGGTGQPPAATVTSSTSSTTTTWPAPLVVQPFAATATFNRPVSEFGTSPRSAEWAARCYRWCSLTGPGKWSLYVDPAWSYALFDARQATTTIPVFRASFGFQGSLRPGERVPWSPAWNALVPTGNDRIVVIVDPPTGREWDLWLVQPPGGNQSACITLENLAANVGAEPGLCVGQGDLILDAAGRPIDYRTATSGSYPTGGAWFASLPMLVTADEVAAGRIGHALNGIAYNTMFGPACPNPTDTSALGFGTLCGGWVPPASRLEWDQAPQQCGAQTMPSTVDGRSRTVPEGVRFFLAITDAEITAWLDGRHYTGRIRETARIFAIALRDYGWIITNTSCYDAGWFTDAASARSKWTALGLDPTAPASQRVMDGLITSTNLRMAGPSAVQSVGALVQR